MDNGPSFQVGDGLLWTRSPRLKIRFPLSGVMVRVHSWAPPYTAVNRYIAAMVKGRSMKNICPKCKKHVDDYDAYYLILGIITECKHCQQDRKDLRKEK